MKIKVGLVGCGVVGTGVVELLLKNKEVIRKKTGIELVLSKVADKDWSRQRAFDVPQELRTVNYEEVLEESHVVVELVGGKGFAKELIEEALKKGKHVVTANKHLLAEEGRAIFQSAQERGLCVGFEASVGGGIPIIKAVRESLVGNNIRAVYGILNGTTNYVLTRMLEEGVSLQDALKEAKEKGYAEADPSLDIDGWDSAHKIAILSFMAFGGFFPFSGVYVEGIRHVDLLDVELGRELGYALKLLSIAKKREEELEVRVHPTFLPEEDPLAKVSDVFNAIMVEGDFVGKVMLYGRGAGAYPTASAVVSDLIDVSRRIISGTPCKESINWEDKSYSLSDNFYSRYYMRFDVPDKPGVLASISRVLADYHISIASVLQKEKVCKLAGREGEHVVPLVILTHKAYERNMRKALEEIQNLPVVIGSPVLIRVEEEAE
ncbi:MAG: homoserine dehydrogenase [Aquificaceae bacterium]|nr:homoserine dehydrogenase [Aquificaceae bacterium]